MEYDKIDLFSRLIFPRRFLAKIAVSFRSIALSETVGLVSGSISVNSAV